MLFFGHVGLSLGAGKIIEKLNRRVDLLFLGIGAIFPDIDKAVSLLLGTGGRALFHTLIFVIALTILAFYSRKLFMKSFALGVWLHLLFDTIWTFPQTFFWPFLGNFDAQAFNAEHTVTYFFADPFIFISETAGFVVFLWVVYKEKLYKIEKIKSISLKNRH